VLIAISAVKETFPDAGGSWTLAYSSNFGKEVLLTLYDEARRLRHGRNYHTQLMNLIKAMNFWKENLDRIHGLMESKPMPQTTVIIRELRELPREELVKLAGMRTPSELKAEQKN